MKELKIFTHLLSTFFLGISFFTGAQAQSNTNTPLYHIVTDHNSHTPIVVGIVSRKFLETDTSFQWFKRNYALRPADSEAVKIVSKLKNQFQIIVFWGSWCEDSQNLLPVLFRMADESGISENNILLLATDREKHTFGNLNNIFQIQNVPTFIIMYKGKEIGRIVEYGKYGMPDKEIAEIVQPILEKK